jgi:hypothetical protein
MLFLTTQFDSVEGALSAHADYLKNIDDNEARRQVKNLPAATAAECGALWDALDAAFAESRTIAEVRATLTADANGRHTSFLMNFSNAAIRLEDALRLTSDRIRATLSSPNRPFTGNEYKLALSAVNELAAAQAELLAAHTLHAAMKSPAGAAGLCIEYK